MIMSTVEYYGSRKLPTRLNSKVDLGRAEVRKNSVLNGQTF